jgi:hypothetical protein
VGVAKGVAHGFGVAAIGVSAIEATHHIDEGDLVGAGGDALDMTVTGATLMCPALLVPLAPYLIIDATVGWAEPVSGYTGPSNDGGARGF